MVFKYNYFCDDDRIDNVTLQLSKFSDFSSRHTVCIMGDDIMYHILVVNMFYYGTVLFTGLKHANIKGLR